MRSKSSIDALVDEASKERRTLLWLYATYLATVSILILLIFSPVILSAQSRPTAIDKPLADSILSREPSVRVVTDSVTVSSAMRKHRKTVADGLRIADMETSYSADGSALIVSFLARYGERVVASREALLVTPVYV